MLISRQSAGESSNQPANFTPFSTIMKHFETINWDSGQRMALGFSFNWSDFRKYPLKTIR